MPFRASTLALVTTSVLVLGCGAGSGPKFDDLEGDGGDLSDGLVIPQDGFATDDAFEQDTRIDPDAACAAQAFDAKRIPPSLYVVFDRSGSMRGAKWDGSTNALNSLVTKSEDTMKVGLTFFPPNESSCEVSAFGPVVPLGPLSATRKSIQCAIGKASGCPGITARSPNGGTPMMPAVQAGVSYMQKVTTDGTRVVILLTDGDPSGCGTIEQVIAEAGKAPAGTPKVLVYVIGAPGGTVRNLSQVASAGGGKRIATCVANTSDVSRACHYQIGDANFEAQLTAALEDIKGKALSCTFAVPKGGGEAGSDIDSNQVNVNYTDASGTTTLDRDPAKANGWDYTDNGETITIYGPRCDALLADPNVKVQLVFGCKTKGPS
jgi:hypothetical protein